MTDPLTVLASAVVLKIAESSTGEATKSLTGAAISKLSELYQRVLNKFKGKNNEKAEKALIEVRQGSQDKSKNLEVHLQEALEEDQTFAQVLHQLNEEIDNINGVNNVHNSNTVNSNAYDKSRANAFGSVSGSVNIHGDKNY